jgi:hypothetical protein
VSLKSSQTAHLWDHSLSWKLPTDTCWDGK